VYSVLSAMLFSCYIRYIADTAVSVINAFCVWQSFMKTLLGYCSDSIFSSGFLLIFLHAVDI